MSRSVLFGGKIAAQFHSFSRKIPIGAGHAHSNGFGLLVDEFYRTSTVPNNT